MGALLCLSRKALRLQWEFGALQADLSALIAYVTFFSGGWRPDSLGLSAVCQFY